MSVQKRPDLKRGDFFLLYIDQLILYKALPL
jgi:hypothetical protein